MMIHVQTKMIIPILIKHLYTTLLRDASLSLQENQIEGNVIIANYYKPRFCFKISHV